MMDSGLAPSASPGVSILLLIKNLLHHLEVIVPRLQEQDYDGDVEYICIDSGSEDGGVAYMRSRGIEVHEIPPREFHHGRTRNLAASLAQNEILVMLSCDALPVTRDWLRHLVAPFSDPEVGGVYGRQTAPAEMGSLRRQALASEYPPTRQVREPRTISRYTPGHFRFSNANGAVRRTLWAQFRWSEEVLLAEDQGLCRDILLAGKKIVYEPEAEVIHGHERSLWGDFKYALDNGVSLSRLGILNNPQIGGELRYGLARMRSDLSYFAKRGRMDCVALSLVSFGMRYAGVQLGKREKQLPHWLLRRISEMHGKMER
jgi:rhamnosyltransferase